MGVIDLEESLNLEKRQQLRNNEYYVMQEIFDELFEKSIKNKKFKDLMKYISSENNILLAYRNIKNNKGSSTTGTDGLDINYLKEMEKRKYVERIQNKFINYTPKSVRRVEIPKQDGRKRPLGIPCIEDRIIQQCIKQILEPICEAKFHKHSYGFRPNRSAKHAIARCMSLMNKAKLHYVVDIDIKSFFDNVNHSKLKKQLWTLGIQDKNLISIIGKILKSEINGIGKSTKGTPQGGIISPLLANITLNELDWWISSQWETYKTKHTYSNSHKYRAMKTTKLKEIWLVRYADDFKIFCRDYKTAQKIFNSTRKWIKERLDLDINTEKSKITNLRRNYTEFLGFKLKVKLKSEKYVCQSRMCDRAIKETINTLKRQIKIMQKNRTPKEVLKLNSIILGVHNYYKCATYITKNMGHIDFIITRFLDIRIKDITNRPNFTKTYTDLYGCYKGRIRTAYGVTIFPIYGCRTEAPMNYSQKICNYTNEGRIMIHNKLGNNSLSLIKKYLLKKNEHITFELFDNSVSLIAGQNGKCFVTQEELRIGNMECHHKKPKSKNGTDEYSNLVWLCTEAHKLVHVTQKDVINKYLNKIKIDKKGLKRLNVLRKLVGNSDI